MLFVEVGEAKVETREVTSSQSKFAHLGQEQTTKDGVEGQAQESFGDVLREYFLAGTVALEQEIFNLAGLPESAVEVELELPQEVREANEAVFTGKADKEDSSQDEDTKEQQDTEEEKEEEVVEEQEVQLTEEEVGLQTELERVEAVQKEVSEVYEVDKAVVVEEEVVRQDRVIEDGRDSEFTFNFGAKDQQISQTSRITQPEVDEVVDDAQEMFSQTGSKEQAGDSQRQFVKVTDLDRVVDRSDSDGKSESSGSKENWFAEMFMDTSEHQNFAQKRAGSEEDAGAQQVFAPLMQTAVNEGAVARQGALTGAEAVSKVDGVVAKSGEGKSQTENNTREQAKGPEQMPRKQQVRVINKIQEVLEQAIRTRDSNTIVVRLDPPKLGAMTIKLTHRGDELFGKISPDNPEVESLLRARINELVHILTASGIDAQNIHLSIGGEQVDIANSLFDQFMQSGTDGTNGEGDASENEFSSEQRESEESNETHLNEEEDDLAAWIA